ncbi:MAG: hypothetical protein K6C69_08290 [Lachnospiraceae bacterium]|nr:hypothetical protein [Lachnospiraceae bacterium]
MTINEKLKHFYASSLEEARAQSNQTLIQYRASLEQEMEDYKKSIDAAEELRKKDAEVKIRRSINHELTEQLIATRKSLTDRHTELKEAIFNEVSTLLRVYRKTADYKLKLQEYIEHILEFAGEDRVTIYMDPEDEKFIDEFSKLYDCDYVVNETSFGGGIRAVIPAREIMIEHAFDTGFAKEYERFSFNGGNSND